MENLIFLCCEWTYKRKKHGNDMVFDTYETIASMTKVIDFPNSWSQFLFHRVNIFI